MTIAWIACPTHNAIYAQYIFFSLPSPFSSVQSGTSYRLCHNKSFQKLWIFSSEFVDATWSRFKTDLSTCLFEVGLKMTSVYFRCQSYIHTSYEIKQRPAQCFDRRSPSPRNFYWCLNNSKGSFSWLVLFLPCIWLRNKICKFIK